MREPFFFKEPPVLVVCELFIPQIMLLAADYVHEANMAAHRRAGQYSGSHRPVGKRQIAASLAGGHATYAKMVAALPAGDVVVRGVCTAERELYPLISPSIDVPGGADAQATIRLVGRGRPPGNPQATAIHFRYFFFRYRAVWRGRYLIRKRGIVNFVFNRRGRYMQAWVMLHPKS